MIIFYAEDDEDDREIFADILREINPNFQLVIAKNGKEALDILRRVEKPLPDIIFLDINMPKMDGFQTLVEIKKSKRLRNIKVVMYSTAIDPKAQSFYKDLNIFFLKKASTLRDIREDLKAIMKEVKTSYEL